MKDIKWFIQVSDGLADPMKRGMLRRLNEIEKKTVQMTKEEAIAFAQNYLKDRQYQINSFDKRGVWAILTEYIFNDIIPYIYGESLD